MFRLALFLVLLVLSAGCQRHGGLPQSDGQGETSMPSVFEDGPRSQVKIAAGDPDDSGLVSFEILAVYPHQKPTDASPWHADAGDWTFFDCRTISPGTASFTVGVRAQSSGGRPIVWGEATIRVADPGEGEKLLDHIGRAFHQSLPPARKQHPLQPWTFRTAVLGEGIKRHPGGGFGGSGGTWCATKWFLDRDGFSAEVFFNYDLKGKTGEFSEKDPEYRQDLLAVLAIVVRDGPRPKRTPLTDPNLTDVGPTFGEARLVARNARFFQFGPGGEKILFSTKADADPTVVWAVAPDQPNQPREVARVQQELGSVTVLDPNVSQLLVAESLPKEKGVFSSDDRQRLWWVDRAKIETRELKGPWEGYRFFLAAEPISPDGRFIAIKSWRPRTDGKRGNDAVIHLVHRESGATQTIEMQNHSPEPMGWIGTGEDLRLAFLENHHWNKDEKQEWYLADPKTGKYVPSQKSPLPDGGLASRASPDGGTTAAIDGKEKLTITDAKTGQKRSFEFHEDDRRFVDEAAIEWVSPRYLLLHLDRLAFLDINTLKMSYALAERDDSTGLTFSPDFKWVLLSKADDGLYVSPVLLPPTSP